MKGRGDRPVRVGERIREEISLLLQHRVKDPGVRAVTVTNVAVTPDLKTARVSYSVFGGDDERLAARDALRRCRGFIRGELGRSLDLRYAPEILFLYDDSYQKGERIDRLLREIGAGEPHEE